MRVAETPQGIICHATHPSQPNYEGNARGRKIHLTTDKKKTLCNMLVDGLEGVEEDGGLWSCLPFNGQCKSCLKVAGITEFQYKPLQEDIKRFSNFYKE